MQKILIISPDPQTARMLSLALELEGIQAIHETNLPAALPRETDLLLLDLVEGEHELREAARALAQLGRKSAKTVVILPRGCDRSRAAKQLSRADVLVTRPFHLTNLVRQTIDLVE